MNITYPSYALECLNKIENNGFEAWFVGGSVRNALLGLPFFDIDITTNALPEQIEKIFEKTIPTGKKHGTVTVIIDSKPIEVTTYRTEYGYNDSRHPDKVEFSKNIKDDLKRRDFTINALAYNPKRNLLDMFGGIDDLKKGVIRCIGNPIERFEEDALRILRAYRFASTLEFHIDRETESATIMCAERLKNISPERIFTELKKLSLGKRPDIISRFLINGHLSHFGMNSLNINANQLCKADSQYRTAIFFALTGAKTSNIKDKLKADNKLVDQLRCLEKVSDIPVPSSKTELKILYKEIKEEHCDLYLSYVAVMFDQETINKIKGFHDDILKNAEAFSIAHLAVNGNDISALGFKGETIGMVLNALIEKVIEKPQLNNKKSLIELAKKIL